MTIGKKFFREHFSAKEDRYGYKCNEQRTIMELKWRREEGEKDIMIRCGCIVKKINTDN